MSESTAIGSRLADTRFGAKLPANANELLAQAGELRSYPAGAILLREGSETSELGIILSGRIALRTLVPERGAVTILTIEDGDVFGWSALVAPHVGTSTAVALEPVEAVVFDAARLRSALGRNETLAASFYPRLLEAVARRLAATRTQLLDLYAGQGGEPW